MKTQFLLLCLWLGVFFNVKAQSPCGSCTVNIASNNSSTYTLSAGQNMCINSGATFSGTISSISSTSKICITGNSTFTGNINNIPAGAEIYIEAGSTYNPSGLYNIGGTITNNGSVSIGTYMTVNAAWTINNTGTLNFNSGMNMNSNMTITNTGTLNFNSGFQSGSGAVTNITNSSTFLTAGYTTINTGSTINNSGTFTASAQQAYTGVTINNTAGSFYFTGSSNTVSSSSVIANSAYMSLNSFTLNGSSMTNASTGTIIFQSTFTLSNTCSFTNNGTANLKSNYQLDNGSTMINNGNLQMNNGNSYLNTNGVFTNNGYIYVNGKVTFGGSSTPTNNCTIVAVNGFTNQSSSTVNNGYILIPLDSDPSNSLVTLEADFTQGTNGWLQGINMTHNGGTVKGSGNYYFSGYTINYQQFGNGASPAANFYDATPTAGSPSSGMFDDGWGSISNTTKNTLTAVDISSRAGGCNASVTSQGTNTECSDGAFITSLVKNGNFSTALSNSTGNTYSSGSGTTYNFSGGSFISQMDYAGTGSSTCPKTNIATNGNTFAIITLGAATAYVGTGSCNSTNQYVFPGDATYSISTQPNFMYIAGNTLAGEEYLVYQQNLTGLTIGKSYTFYFYASNMRETSGDDPIIRLRIGGSDGVPDGTVGYGPYVLTEAATKNSASLSGWRRFAYNFVATATTLKIKITDAAFTSSGDEWALTSIGVSQCRTLDNDGDGVPDRIDVDDDNDGILDINEYGCSGTSTFTWGTSGTPTAQTVNGVTLTPYLRNPFSLSTTTITQSNAHTANASNDIKFVHNPDLITQYAELVFSFSKKVANVSFEINDIDSRNNGANKWKDSIYVYYYKDGNTYTLQPSEYSLGTEVYTPTSNSFVTNQINNNLANTSNNGRVIITVTDPVDSIGIRYFDNNPNKKDAEIYISSINFCPVLDTDGDGLYDYQDLDSDNDGIPDVIENYGVDTDGDGRIDGTFSATTGLSTRLTSSGLALADFDGDGVYNFRDLDSDNDGIPDILEAGGTDSNNDGKVDSFTDANSNGLQDALEDADALITSGTDTNNDGIANSWPNANQDLLGYPNPYDLDSDGDGILDVIESGLVGLSGSNGTVSASNGIVSGTRTNGWANTVDGLASIALTNSDGVGKPNYLDIDSDNDGITDNVEAQSTTSYKLPTDTDSDNDGIADVYETAAQIGSYGGSGLTPFDKDGDTTPDFRDTDTDNDGVMDRNEGADRNYPTFLTISQATIDASGDTDGDGLMDVFDNINITTLSAGTYYKNVTMGNMGALGGFDGPTPTGSLVGLQQSDASAERDWRNAGILPLHIINFTVHYQSPVANIKWDVVNELQVNYYEVEVSTNGTDFASVQKLSARNTGSNSYAYAYIPNNLSSIFYYRIKQIDKDGNIFYTQVVSIRINKTVELSVGPNPFKSFVSISYQSNLKEEISIDILTIDGKTIVNKKMIVDKGINSIQLGSLDAIAPGTYIVRVHSSNTIATKKIIKNQ